MLNTTMTYILNAPIGLNSTRERRIRMGS